DTTFPAYAERTSMPLDLLLTMREAIGFARPEPEDLLRDVELELIGPVELMNASVGEVMADQSDEPNRQLFVRYGSGRRREVRMQSSRRRSMRAVVGVGVNVLIAAASGTGA